MTIARALSRLLCGAVCAAAWTAHAQQIAITIDDLPAHDYVPKGVSRVDVARQIIAALKAAQVPQVYGFINAGELEDEPELIEVLKLWREAGWPLANHTYTHADLTTMTTEQYIDDIQKNEPVLRQMMPNADWHWFRYPYLQEGDTIEKRHDVKAWLAAHGYQVAEVTMNFQDYLWNEPYARCMDQGDGKGRHEIKVMRKTYLKSADESYKLFRTLSDELYHRDVKYVLLMHLGAFDAQMLPKLLADYKRRGVTFITLEEAMTDPAYKDDPDLATKDSGALLEQLVAVRKLNYPKVHSYDERLNKMCGGPRPEEEENEPESPAVPEASPAVKPLN